MKKRQPIRRTVERRIRRKGREILHLSTQRHVTGMFGARITLSLLNLGWGTSGTLERGAYLALTANEAQKLHDALEPMIEAAIANEEEDRRHD